MSRFFHTLVVFGASLPACGGTTLDTVRAGDPDPGAPDDGGSANSSGGTRATGAGGTRAAGAGGTPTTGAGGTPVTGAGGRPVESGGSPASGGAVTDGGIPIPATAAQWSCDTTACGYVSGPEQASRLFLFDPCPVDPRRPRTPADCAPGQWFECVGAEYLSSPVSVNCRCSTPDVDADAACGTCLDRHYPEIDVPVISCEDGEKLCGCAITVILR